MAGTIRAVYEQGRLRPLDPVDLADGQEVRLVIVPEREQARAALTGLLVQAGGAQPDMDLDEADAVAMIDTALQGRLPLSDLILEERRLGP